LKLKLELLKAMRHGCNNLPSGKTAVTSRIVLQTKLGIDGSVGRFKSRLGAHGFKQRPGVDYHSTYAPLIGPPAVRQGLPAAAARDDVSNSSLFDGLILKMIWLMYKIIK
jgi:hypothetical protein